MKRKSESKFSKAPVILIDVHTGENICRGIYEKATELEYRVLDLGITLHTIPPNLNAAGLITTKFPDDPTVQSMIAKKLPIIRVGTLPEEVEDKKIPAVLPDPVTSGKLAADHFFDRQFKHVGFVGNEPWSVIPYVYNSFRKRALELGCECHLLQIKTPSPAPAQKRYEARKKQILDWLKNIPRPTGIFTYNDLSAARIYTIATNAGYEIPEEFALLGYFNIKKICNFLPVPLSSIDVNREEQGRFSVELFHQLAQGATKPTEPIIIPPKGVVIRQSTNLLAVPDPVVAKALRFIWDHFTEQLSIDDIAFAAGVARSTITRKFRRYLGHSVYSEILRKRLELSCSLLVENQLIIRDIADKAGFQSSTYFNKVFTNAMGMSPSSYRKKHSISKQT